MYPLLPTETVTRLWFESACVRASCLFIFLRLSALSLTFRWEPFRCGEELFLRIPVGERLDVSVAVFVALILVLAVFEEARLPRLAFESCLAKLLVLDESLRPCNLLRFAEESLACLVP